MQTRPWLDQYKSIHALIATINSKPAWRRCQLAGRYAYEQTAAAYDHNRYELIDVYFREDGGDTMFTTHLNVLAKHGCRFTKPIALEWAKGYADLPFDLGD